MPFLLSVFMIEAFINLTRRDFGLSTIPKQMTTIVKLMLMGKITVKQIKGAISHDNMMVDDYPGSVYFDDNKSRKERIIKRLAALVYYDTCAKLGASKSHEIDELLLAKKVPGDVIKFFTETGNGRKLSI